MSFEYDVEQLYLAHSERLRRYLFLKTGEAELAADLTQECFIRLIARVPEKTPDNILSYLYTVAVHLLIDHRRNHHQARTAATPPEDLHAIQDSASGPELRAEASRRLERLQLALVGLPRRSRHVFQLCRLEGMTYAAAARHLGISVSSVQKHLALALRFVSEQVDAEEGGT